MTIYLITTIGLIAINIFLLFRLEIFMKSFLEKKKTKNRGKMKKKELRQFIKDLLEKGFSDAYTEAAAYGKRDSETSIYHISKMIKNIKSDNLN